MTKLIVSKRVIDTGCMVTYFAPEMFDLMSSTRREMRHKGIDFPDGAAMIALKNQKQMSDEDFNQWYLQSNEYKDHKKLAETEIITWITQQSAPSYRALMLKDETEAAAKSRLQVSDLNVKLPYRVTDSTYIPMADRTFREAWTDDNATETVDVNMPVARGIWMNYLRALRNTKLTKLDQDYLRADEQGNAQLKKQIADQKQALRDMPQTYDLSGAKNPAELKAMIPDILKG